MTVCTLALHSRFSIVLYSLLMQIVSRQKLGRFKIMADQIVLCGASSVGKTTVANDWCDNNKCFVHIQEVARDVMHECSITRDDLKESLRTNDKQVFLNLQEAILKEQNKRELAVPSGHPFISDRGPDPLIFTYQYVGSDAADRLAGSSAGQTCLERYRRSLVVVLCPLGKPTDDGFRLVPTTCEQCKFTTLLCKFLTRYRIPYINLNETDHNRRMALIGKAVKGEIPLDSDSKSYPLHIPFTLQEKSPHQLIITLRSLQFSMDKVQCFFKAFSPGKSNRMIQRYGKDNFLLTTFHRKIPPFVVLEVLRKGLLVNGEEYHFLGCSSSGLRNRTCYLYKGTEEEVEAVLEECGSFSKIKSVSVKLKRIGLLFSEASPTGIEISDEDVIEVEDIEKEAFNFTDGCGALSINLAKRIKRMATVHFQPEDYLPCVFQIRYQGCKGVVVIDPGLRDNQIMIRKSMKKFDPGRKPFPELWLCDQSRPYSYGHLNKQFIMLLSGLGVKDDVFLSKQMEHFRRLELMSVDPTIAFEMLQWNNIPDLAARAANHSPEKLQSDKSIQRELSKLKSKLIEKLEKLQLFVSESRTVFGVCDPLGVLKYGECFFRPTIRGQPCTLSGYVTVAKNPCYLLGDVRRLQAISTTEVQHLEHLTDCIVFPTTGKQPHPNEIAGSDLDGDQYFVCWEKNLVIPTTCKPYDYPASDSKYTSQVKPLEYFAKQNQQSMTMGKIDTYFKYWANKNGINCNECEELGRFFAHSVDSAKTGVKVSVPRNLLPPKNFKNQEQVVHQYVWSRMEEAAMKEKQKLSENMLHDSVPGAVTEQFIWSLLQDMELNMFEFQLFCFVKDWCFKQQYTDEEGVFKLINFCNYINFGKFTVEQQVTAMDVGVPREIVTNAFNKSKLLTPPMRANFYLDSTHCDWKFYFCFDPARFEGQHLLRALGKYSQTMVTFQLQDTVTIALHFLEQLQPGTTRLIAGSVVAYLFSPHFGLSERYVLGQNYTVQLDNEMLQIFRGEKQATFVKIAFEDYSQDETVYDQISVDLTRFKRDILTKFQHRKVRKGNFHCIEVFVNNVDHKPTHFDILLADFPGEFTEPVVECVEEVPFEEELHEEKLLNLESMQPYSREVALGELQIAAHTGNVSHFNTLQQFILCNESTFIHLSSNLESSLLTLLTAMVAGYGQKQLTPDTQDCLQQTVVTTLDFSLQTSLSKLQLLDRLFRLNYSCLANLIVQGLQPSTVSDFFEAVSNWQLWCFFPPTTAHDILDKIKPHPVSISQQTTHCSEDIHTATTEYTLHFSHVLLHHFIDEVHESAVKEADFTLKLLKARDVNSPKSIDDKSGIEKPAKWRVALTGKTGISSSKFTVGTFVMISPMQVSSTIQFPIMAQGHIIQVCRQPTNIVLELEEPIPHCLRLSAKQSKGHWQVKLIGNVITYKRCIKSITKVFNEKLGSTKLLPFLVPAQKCSIDITSNSITKCSHEAKEVAQSTSPLSGKVALSVYQHQTCPKYSLRNYLNESQQKAVDAAVSQHITLIHGPPGTGKTHTASEIVHRVCQNGFSRKTCKGKVLVAAETNMAVDNLTRKLLQRNLIVVRVGNIEHMADDVRYVSLERQLEMKHLQLERDRRKSHFVEAQGVLSAAEVIACTCAGAGDSVLKDLVFPFVLIDEATQVTEPMSLVPLVHQCEQLVLIGDPQQLPPTLINSSNASHCLSVSLFHRLHKLIPSFFLEEQHRMHPALAEFPSDTFYSGRLKSAPSLSERKSSFGVVWPETDRPFVFINLESSREQRCITSYQNIVEAEMVVKVVLSLLSKNVNQTEIAVLTPYAGQVKCIRERLGQVAKHVEVCSVDGFQGREKEIILFSTVRTRMLGFTADKQRMNVLLTRAKQGIIGIGCSKALSADPIWALWLSQVHIEESECFLQSKCTVHTKSPKGALPAIENTPSANTDEVHVRTPKDRVCRLCNFIEKGCRNGEKCKYAHSLTELNVWRHGSRPKFRRGSGRQKQ